MDDFNEVPWAKPRIDEVEEQVITPRMKMDIALQDLEIAMNNVAEAAKEL